MQNKNWLGGAILAAALAMPAAGFAQNISVIIDGQPVAFNGMQPTKINGRVLVPLRGVMEKLGAYVGWEPRTRTVSANKPGVDLVLHLGDRNATVNGQNVRLDVPPQEIRGSTMVPLRFVGEALGAEVKWDNATYTVNITTTAATNPNEYTPPNGNNNNNNNTGTVSITSFDVDHRGTARGGEILKFTLIGTPNGQATFSIPGVIQDVAMTETQSGVYTGSFRVPAKSPINISEASAIARLKVGNAEKLIQSGDTLAFDNQAPELQSLTPEPGTRVTRDRPNISATFDDSTGSGIDPTTVELMIDGRRATGDAQVTERFISYRPDRALESGRHEVILTAKDRAGNPVSKTWDFRVVGNSDVIKSFTHDAENKDLLPGTEVTFTLVGEPGGTATFNIGDRNRDRRMQEVEPGRYVGTYTIRRNDTIDNLPVTAKLTTKEGDTFTYEAATRLRANLRSLEAPEFTAPEDNDKVGNQVTFKGTAAPGSKVQIKIDYIKSALGFLNLRGTVAELEVTADEKGNWKTDPIDMNTGLGGGSVTFNVTAVTVGSNGKKSDEAKLTLKR